MAWLDFLRPKRPTLQHIVRDAPPLPPVRQPAPEPAPISGPDEVYTLQDPKAFYAAVRAITGRLDQAQVDTIERLLKGAAHWPVPWLAYGLATAWHEARLKPIAEWGKGRGRPYAKRGKYGQSQYGRGLVQLTWDANYEKADKALGLGGALLRDFDLALDPDIAARILVWGMEMGAFTGRRLSDCIRGDVGRHNDFIAARAIINGKDKAALIADYAERFQAALWAGKWKD